MKPFLSMLLFSMFVSAHAGNMAGEVEHLLQYVEQSGCIFERNGSEHDAREARKHIERKYDYLKSRLQTTEQFIRYAASESSITGRKYHVICNGKRMLSSEWLNTELKRYREHRNDSASKGGGKEASSPEGRKLSADETGAGQ